MSFLQKVYQIFLFELRGIMRDSGVFLFVLIVPLAYPLVYGFIYNNETVREVPVAVVDEADSPLSRQFVRMLDATPDVRVVERARSMAQAEELNRLGKTYGTVRIPADLDRRLARGEQATIGVYADMAGMLYYKSLMLQATNVSLELNKQLKVERFYLGATPRQEQIATQPIAYDYVTLFNPRSGFAAFVLPPVLMLIIQQTLMLGIGMVGGATRERYKGRALPRREEFDNPLAVVLGKTMVYLPLYLIIATYFFTFVTWLFGLPMLGRLSDFLLLMLPYILACIFMAMVYSSFIYRREDCILLFVFMSVPLLFISGVSWPGAAIPEFWKVIGTIFPSTYGVNGYVHLQSMGATLGQLAPQLGALWLQAAIYLLLALLFYRKAGKSA